LRERRPSSLLAALVLTLAVVPAGCRDAAPGPRDAGTDVLHPRDVRVTQMLFDLRFVPDPRPR
jgi:hypothetical protein